MAVIPILRVKVVERTPNVPAVPRFGVVAAYAGVAAVKKGTGVMTTSEIITSISVIIFILRKSFIFILFVIQSLGNSYCATFANTTRRLL